MQNIHNHTSNLREQRYNDPLQFDSPKTPILPNNDSKFKMIVDVSKLHALSDEKGQISKKVFKPDSSAYRIVNLTTEG
jgi:hypothetical protein